MSRDVFLLALLFCASYGEASKVIFPKIVRTQGKSWIALSAGEKENRKLVKLNEELKGSAHIEVGIGAELKIQLDLDRELTLFESSQIQIPAIAWESGEAPIIILLRGSFRWKVKGIRPRYNVLLKSDLFDLLAPDGDFVFSYDPDLVKSEVRCYQGKIEFSATNGDQSIVVEKGQKGSFSGVKEQGEIIYDILLQGKKIPRGQLVGPVVMSKMEAQMYSEATEKKNLEIKMRRILEKKAQMELFRKEQICEKPYGKMNLCAWILEKGSTARCIRYRCDGNGRWSEPYIVPKGQSGICQKDPVVENCDY